MKLIAAFFRLIRSVNLLFIALTQFLFQYCIVAPSFRHVGLPVALTPIRFVLLVVASLCIAAGGYIINDYFDLNIDQVNKPHKLVVERIIKRRWAILWHFGLSGLGILLSFYVGWKVNNLLIGVINLLCVVLLWFYSTTFKKKLLLGNIIISLLTGWVVLVLYVIEMPRHFQTVIDTTLVATISKIFKLAVLYGGFAFIISLVREVIKDIEDMPGDAKHGCYTMPIVWGVNVSKVFIATWLIVLIAAIGIVQVYIIPLHWWWSVIYSALLIICPLLYIFRKLFVAKTQNDFHQLSNWVKWVMLSGILSMIFFKIYA